MVVTKDDGCGVIGEGPGKDDLRVGDGAGDSASADAFHRQRLVVSVEKENEKMFLGKVFDLTEEIFISLSGITDLASLFDFGTTTAFAEFQGCCDADGFC